VAKHAERLLFFPVGWAITRSCPTSSYKMSQNCAWVRLKQYCTCILKSVLLLLRKKNTWLGKKVGALCTDHDNKESINEGTKGNSCMCSSIQRIKWECKSLNPVMEPLCKPHIKTESARRVLNVDEIYKDTVQKTVYKFYNRDVQLVFKFKMQTTEPQGKKSSIRLKSCFTRKINSKGLWLKKLF